MGAPPRVSILLPTHNRADVLRFAIESALAQTMPDFELLVVGDGCTDSSAQVVAEFRDDRIRWFDLPKAPGFGYANRNAGLREARGDLIAYLAHDDLWFPDHLELLVRCFDSRAVEFAYSRPLDVSQDGRITPQTFNLEDRRTQDRWLRWWEGYLTSTSVAHRASCLARYGYWSERMHHGADWDLWMRIFVGGGRRNLAFQPTPAALHFVAGRRWIAASEMSRRRRFWDWLGRRAATEPALTVTAPAGTTQQEVILRRLLTGGRDGATALRRAAQADLDRSAALESPLRAAMTLVERLRLIGLRRRRRTMLRDSLMLDGSAYTPPG